MTTFSVIPGTLNVTVKRGDRLQFTVDFTNALTGYTVASEVYSMVDGRTMLSMSTNIASEANGIVQVTLSSSETASLAAGTYKWKLRWDEGAGACRTALNGIFEVIG